MGNRDEAMRWFKQAEMDFKYAENNINFGAFELSCFLAHQAAEKALKSVLYSLGLRPFGHSLLNLIEEIKKNEIPIKIDEKCVRELDKHYINTRYPDAFVSGIPHDYYDRNNAEDCLKWSIKILESVRNYLKSI